LNREGAKNTKKYEKRITKILPNFFASFAPSRFRFLSRE